MEDRYNEILEILKKYEQEHLLKNYNKLDNNQKEILLNQISEINFEQLENLFKKTEKKEKLEINNIEPIEYIVKKDIPRQEKENYDKLGEAAIKKGELAVVTMAGGQGTRLGHKGPKGTFYLGTNPDKSLFEILCDKLKYAKKQYNIKINWYIMTSEENNDDTVEFFKENNYFGYDKENVLFFKQGVLPMLLENGKIIQNEKGFIKLAADGHGGIFSAMFKNNIIDHMKKNGIKWIFIGPVDNPLVNFVDPTMIGLGIEKQILGVGKSLVKANAHEKVGVFCKKNGKPSVIEYTEITDDLAEAKNEKNEFLYGEAHINCNLFNIKALEKIGDKKLPYHVAFKKSKYIDENGNIVEPKEPNSYKFESFIFDAFEQVDGMMVLRVEREDEFAPVKGLTGEDSAESARKMYEKYCTKYNI